MVWKGDDWVEEGAGRRESPYFWRAICGCKCWHGCNCQHENASQEFRVPSPDGFSSICSKIIMICQFLSLSVWEADYHLNSFYFVGVLPLKCAGALLVSQLKEVMLACRNSRFSKHDLFKFSEDRRLLFGQKKKKNNNKEITFVYYTYAQLNFSLKAFSCENLNICTWEPSPSFIPIKRK